MADSASSAGKSLVLEPKLTWVEWKVVDSHAEPAGNGFDTTRPKVNISFPFTSLDRLTSKNLGGPDLERVRLIELFYFSNKVHGLGLRFNQSNARVVGPSGSSLGEDCSQ